jgi:short-subunit dehydrogenase involved in D-alanine esterification of teichoic acids
MSSIAAFIGVAGVGAYSGSKAALIARCAAWRWKCKARDPRQLTLRRPLVDTAACSMATGRVVGSLEQQAAIIRWVLESRKMSRMRPIFFLSEQVGGSLHNASHGRRIDH